MKYTYINLSYREKTIKDDRGKNVTIKPLGGQIVLEEETAKQYPFLRNINETNLVQPNQKDEELDEDIKDVRKKHKNGKGR